MRNHSVNVEDLGIDRVGNDLCLFGKVKLVDEDEVTTLKIKFDGFPCKTLGELLNLLRNIPFTRSDLIELPGIYLLYEGVEKEYLIKAVRELFAIAVSSIPEAFVEISIAFKEEWEEA